MPKILFTNTLVVLLCQTTSTVLPFVLFWKASEYIVFGLYNKIGKFLLIAVGFAVSLVDYNNYKPINSSVKLNNLDKIFQKGELKKISEIILEDIKIKFN